MTTTETAHPRLANRIPTPWHGRPARVFAILYPLFSILAFCSAAAPPNPGQVTLTAENLKPGTQIDLTGDWLFKPFYQLQSGEAPQSAPDNAGYLKIPVPHLLNRIQWWLDDSEDFKKWEADRLAKLGFDTDKSDDGWYRMWIDAPKLADGQHLWIEFDGVAMRSRTFLNGKELGHHDGMFSRFAYDLTPHLKPGKNLLAVHVAMEGIPDSDAKLGEAVTVNLSAAKVISMSKGMFGPLTPRKNNREYDLYGIWQPVKLVVRGGAKIDDAFFRANPDLKGFKVDIEASPHGYTGPVIIRTRIPLDPSGFFEATNPATLRKDGLKTTVGGGGDPTPFQPWTPATPNLYPLTITLETPDGKVLDTWSHKVGFRTFEAKGNQLLLNGKPYWLRGANQLPYGKNPFSPDLARKLIQHLHDNNINSTRTHCTPWNQAWLDAADEIGLGVSIEGIRPWALAGKSDPPVMPPPAIVAHWLMENEDVVKRCRNHPSVLMFTVGNEMLLRDAKSVEKWKILSDVVKQTRALAGGLPVIASSDHVREPETYETVLKPNNFDDGDVDDMHKYHGWYSDSPFVMDMTFPTESKRNAGKRPLIGQEISTGYPDLDSGFPVWRYTRDLVTPLAWVGRWSYPGGAGFGQIKRSDTGPEIYLENNRVITKRMAEKLRYQSHAHTAGFSLFSAECWFSHPYDPATVKPYPVLAAAKEFWNPIGLALETNQRRFYSGDTIKTNVFITNDDDQFRNLRDLEVMLILTSDRGDELVQHTRGMALADLPYYQTATVPVSLKLPSQKGRAKYSLATVVSSKGQILSRTTDWVEIFPKLDPPTAEVIVTGDADRLSADSDLRKKIEQGATVILTSPGKNLLKHFPDDILDVKANDCEYADWSPVMGTALAKDLTPMDIKWWARKNDPKCFVAPQSHRLKQGGKARSLIDYTPSHSYIAAEKVPEQFRTVLFEIPIGQGRLWVCDLDFDASAGVDPAADLLLRNLLAAAADKTSTSNLPQLPSHEEIVKTVARPQQ